MNPQEYRDLLAPVSALVRSVRPMILEHAVGKITAKGDNDFVTATDYAVQKILEEGLHAIRPDFAFLGEESADHRLDLNVPTWVIDPIDGTTNFIHRYAFSCVSVGLVLGGDTLIGVVYNPYMDELFSAARGFGATLNDRPISVSEIDDFRYALVNIGTMAYHKNKTADAFRLWKRLFCAGSDIRRSGSAALDLCYVAVGRTEMYAEPALCSWDFAAGAVILREAGGKLTDWYGTPLVCDGKRHSVAASNGILHDEFCRIIAEEDVMSATEIE